MPQLKFILALLLVLTLGDRAEAAWAHIQSNTPSSSSSTCTTCTCVATVSAMTPGNLGIVSALITGTQTSATATAADGASVSWTAGPIVSQSGRAVALFFNPNVGSPTTVTVTFTLTGGSGTQQRSCIADEYSGNATSGAIDPSGGGAGQFQVNPGTAANAITSGNITTTQNGDLVYAVTYATNNTPSLSAGTGFSARVNSSSCIGDCASEDQVQSAGGSIAGTFTQGTGNTTWGTLVAAFRVPIATQFMIHGSPF